MPGPLGNPIVGPHSVLMPSVASCALKCFGEQGGEKAAPERLAFGRGLELTSPTAHPALSCGNQRP